MIVDPNEANRNLTAAELTGLLGRHERHATTLLGDVTAAAGRWETDRNPYYGDTRSQFKNRAAQSQAALLNAEAVATDWLTETRRDLTKVRHQIEGTSGLSLSAEEMAVAGSIVPTLATRQQGARLSDVAAELRNALQRNDRTLLAAHMIAAQARLTSTSERTADGKVPLDADKDELRRLVGEANFRLRDTSLDPLKERLAKTVAATGKLGATVFKQQEARKPFETAPDRDGRTRPKVRWDDQRGRASR